jgi:hypothetical protein
MDNHLKASYDPFVQSDHLDDGVTAIIQIQFARASATNNANVTRSFSLWTMAQWSFLAIRLWQRRGFYMDRTPRLMISFDVTVSLSLSM